MKLHIRFIKSYKRTSLILILGIVLSIAVMISMLIITTTDDRLELVQEKYLQGQSEIKINSLNRNKINKLKSIPQILKYGFCESKKEQIKISEQFTSVTAASRDYILKSSLLLKGRIPQNDQEIVAERWVLGNLKIAPNIGAKIKGSFMNGQDKEYRLVGIISDDPFAKSNGNLEMYTGISNRKGQKFNAVVDFETGVRFSHKVNQVKEILQLHKSNIHCIDNEKTGFHQSLVMLFFLLVFGIIFMGIYRITILTRMKQYGIFKAVGMKRKQLLLILEKEMLVIAMIGIPIGMVLGVSCAYEISLFSQKNAIRVISWGKVVSLSMQVPVLLCIYCVIGVISIIVLVVFFYWGKLERLSVTELLSGSIQKKRVTMIRMNKIKNYRSLAMRYVFTDMKNAIFIVLSISIGCCIFIGVFYQAFLDCSMNENKKVTNFLSGDFKLAEYADDTVKTGISLKTVQKIQSLKGIKDVETQMLMPCRTIENPAIKKNDYFYNVMDSMKRGTYLQSYSGKDEHDLVYKNFIRGYNTNALRKLHSYLIEGEYNPETLHGDQVILFMPEVSDDNLLPGYIRNGQYVRKYRIGNSIQIKFRKDLDVSSDAYWSLKDKGAKYCYHTYKIVAIVYYPYMDETSSAGRVNPDVIMSDKQLQSLTGIQAYSTVNVNVEQGLSDTRLSRLEDKIIHASWNDHAVIARSIINEKRQIDHMYEKQMIYKYGITVVICILSFVNIITNMKYRIVSRKKEFSIYRAIGMKNSEVGKMLIFENCCLGAIAWGVTVMVSNLLRKKLYRRSMVAAINIAYKNDIVLLVVMLGIILLICIVLSILQVRALRKSSIIHAIETIE